ncbi:hypothetical protein ACWJJH_03025 [Endozoicomonadaceae bacterium StTr2]
MKDINTCHTLFLDRVAYDHESFCLSVEVTEASRLDSKVTETISGLEIEAYPIEPTENSCRYRVIFDDVVCHFVVDDFYRNAITSADEYEGVHLLTLKKNVFIDFIGSATLVPQLMEPESTCYYCLITEKDHIFVCSQSEYRVESIISVLSVS